MNYKGIIIEESLTDSNVLTDVIILGTEIEIVTEGHKTPWIKQWTMHTVEIEEEKVEQLAKQISENLDNEHTWYADFKNDMYHFIIYPNKVFRVDINNPTLYNKAREYGISIGIPKYQMDFAPKDNVWVR